MVEAGLPIEGEDVGARFSVTLPYQVAAQLTSGLEPFFGHRPVQPPMVPSGLHRQTVKC